MHDLDRTRLEADFDDELEFEDELDDDNELDELEQDGMGAGEFEYEYELESGSGRSVFDEGEEMELASELLEISDDEELELFFGKAIRRGFRKLRKRARRALRGRLGRRLRKGLRGVARRALRGAGRVAGGAFGGPLGAAIGGRVASGAGRALGLELEGLSPEDQEFEVARRIVRMTGEAAATAAAIPESVDDDEAGRIALSRTIGRNAPGMVRRRERQGGSGRWVRKGRRIVLMGV